MGNRVAALGDLESLFDPLSTWLASWEPETQIQILSYPHFDDKFKSCLSSPESSYPLGFSPKIPQAVVFPAGAFRTFHETHVPSVMTSPKCAPTLNSPRAFKCVLMSELFCFKRTSHGKTYETEDLPCSPPLPSQGGWEWGLDSFENL